MHDVKTILKLFCLIQCLFKIISYLEKIYFYGDKNKTRGKLRGGGVKRREYKQTVKLVLFFVILLMICK